jgi:hypothetical protein
MPKSRRYARLAAARGWHSDVVIHARSAVFAAADAPFLVRAYAAVTEARAWALNGNAGQTLAAVGRSRAAFDRAAAGTAPRAPIASAGADPRRSFTEVAGVTLSSR